MNNDKMTNVRNAFAGERGTYPAYYEDGQVKVYDSVAGHFTTCHSLTDNQIARVKRLTMGYTHMVVRKITGIVVSRHTSFEAAVRKARRWERPEEDPVEVRTYSEWYYREMK